jgi:hypothetical protein
MVVAARQRTPVMMMVVAARQRTPVMMMMATMRNRLVQTLTPQMGQIQATAYAMSYF